MKPIGGYFELELHKDAHQYHDTPYLMKSGRSALFCILTFVKPTLVYIPYYTCDALLEPFKIAGIPYEFYEVNDRLEPKELIGLKPGEYFLYINYLDLKRDVVSKLSARYKENLIVDCTQAFFIKGNNISWFFNSCRKFFGVADGSYLYVPARMQMPLVENRNEEYIFEHLLKRFNGYTNEGYNFFIKNEVLAGHGIAAMSKLSEYLLSAIEYDKVIEKRLANYAYLHSRLKHINLFDAAHNDNCVPMSYPLLLKESINKSTLFDKNIFIPTFWNDTLSRADHGFELEKDITVKLLPLPVDHRYSLKEMELICTLLANII